VLTGSGFLGGGLGLGAGLLGVGLAGVVGVVGSTCGTFVSASSS